MNDDIFDLNDIEFRFLRRCNLESVLQYKKKGMLFKRNFDNTYTLAGVKQEDWHDVPTVKEKE